MASCQHQAPFKLQVKSVYSVVCHIFNADMPTENYKLSKYLIGNSRSVPCVT